VVTGLAGPLATIGGVAQGGGKIEHFEIPADDIARAQAFYATVLGFEYEPWGDEMGMLRQPEGEGINGDLHIRGATPHPTVVFTVDRIEDTVALAVANGGSQLGEIQPLDESSRWVYIRDSEGNIIGLYDEVSAA
jgi:predicted enzyme related to lactoylglutathione lyase